MRSFSQFFIYIFVVDLSAIDRWQKITDLEISKATLERLSAYCSEFLIHAADVEGLCRGIDEVCTAAFVIVISAAHNFSLCGTYLQALVEALGQWSPIPCTYAGGGRAIEDLALVSFQYLAGHPPVTKSLIHANFFCHLQVDKLSKGRVDLTFGSALDIFGGQGVKLTDCIEWNQRQPRPADTGRR